MITVLCMVFVGIQTNALIATSNSCIDIKSTSAVCSNTTFEEGVHYKELSLPKSTIPELKHFFSFFDDRCYQFQPLLKSLEKEIPSEVTVNKIPVASKKGNKAYYLSKAYVIAMSFDITEKIVPRIFDLIHKKEQELKESAIRQLFIDAGIDPRDYDAAYTSFGTDSMVSNFNESFKEAGLTMVPNFLVNNKYLVLYSNLNSEEEYLNLIKFLLNK